jgi:hypothetical protein
MAGRTRHDEPTLAPFAAIGLRSRWFYVSGALLAVTLLLPWWADYLTVLGNLRGFGLTYSAHDLAILATLSSPGGPGCVAPR